MIIPEVVLIQLSSWRWALICSKHVEDSNKRITEEIVCQFGYLPELYEDARSEKILKKGAISHFRNSLLLTMSAIVNPVEHLKMQSVNFKVMVLNNTLTCITNTLIWRHDGLIRKECNCRNGLKKVLLAGTPEAGLLLHPAYCSSARRCHGWASIILVLHCVAIPRRRLPAVSNAHKCTCCNFNITSNTVTPECNWGCSKHMLPLRVKTTAR